MGLADRLTAAPEQPEPAGKGSIEVGPDGATITDVVVDAPIHDDWSHVFRRFNLDPDAFVVVDDTVRMSTWETSRRLDNGDRDVQALYSYRARFRRRTSEDLPADVVETWRTALLADDPTPVATVGDSTYLILVADPQLGKRRTDEAVHNWRTGVQGHLATIRRLQAHGVPLSAIHVAFQGDETEGVSGNYANQVHTVELNLSQQLELDFDMRVFTLRTLAAAGLPMSASSVISNHGTSWTRIGGKDPITSQGDNSSTHIARQVKKLFDEVEAHGGTHVEWHIAGGDPGVVVNLSGKDCYFTHGYMEKGRGTSSETRTRSAIERQILGRTDELGSVPLYYAAHYHHSYSQEFEGRSLFGCPALEAERSSEYMLNQFGVWSPPGMLGMRVGQHNRRGWSDLSVL